MVAAEIGDEEVVCEETVGGALEVASWKTKDADRRTKGRSASFVEEFQGEGRRERVTHRINWRENVDVVHVDEVVVLESSISFDSDPVVERRHRDRRGCSGS